VNKIRVSESRLAAMLMKWSAITKLRCHTLSGSSWRQVPAMLQVGQADSDGFVQSRSVVPKAILAIQNDAKYRRPEAASSRVVPTSKAWP
jgi:hypothetical protein